MEKLLRFINGIGLGIARFFERETGHTIMALTLLMIGIKIADQATRAAAAHDLIVYGLGVMSTGMGREGKQ